LTKIKLLTTYLDSFACAKGDREELHQEFPELEDQDIQQALIFASSYLDDSLQDSFASHIIELPNRYETVA
jgi:hypothetical protein